MTAVDRASLRVYAGSAMAIRTSRKSPISELDELHEKPPEILRERFRDFVRCIVEAMLEPQARDRQKERHCIEALSEAFAITTAFADVLGRTRALQEVPAKLRAQAVAVLGFEGQPGAGQSYVEAPNAELLTDLLGLGFDDAVSSMLEAVPEIARTQTEITDVYRRGGFSLVRAADLATVQKVQQVIARATAIGEPIEDVEAAMAVMDETFTRSYSELVFRNATSRAYSAGRQRQAVRMPGVVGFEYMATLDADVRDSHRAADGVMAAQDDPVWDRLTPPLISGHNCRCAIRLITRLEAERRNLLDTDGNLPRARIPAGAGPDPGGSWGQRADSIYRGRALSG